MSKKKEIDLIPHHDKDGKIDWTKVNTAVQLVSLRGIEGRRIEAEPQEIIDFSKHLAEHFRENKRPIPNELLILI